MREICAICEEPIGSENDDETYNTCEICEARTCNNCGNVVIDPHCGAKVWLCTECIECSNGG